MSATVLRNLRRFIDAKREEVDERHEIREYVLAHAHDIAEAFGRSEEELERAVADIGDDYQLAGKLLLQIKIADRQKRERSAAEREERARGATDAIARGARWERDRAVVDIGLVLGLGHTSGRVVFQADAFAVGVRRDLLRAVAALRKPALTGWVDDRALHIRWPGGGLSLRSDGADDGPLAVVSIPDRPADFRLEPEGFSLALLTPLTERARQWVDSYCDVQPYQWLGGSLAIDKRYAASIAEAALASGLTLERKAA